MSHDGMRERVTALEEWVRGHEALCAQRYGDLKETVTWLVRGVFGMLIAIVAWLAIQLWNGSQARLGRLEAARTAASLDDLTLQDPEREARGPSAQNENHR